MQQPDGFVIDGQERKVCRLIKSLYGLKQAPKQWHDKYNTTLTSVGFVVTSGRIVQLKDVQHVPAIKKNLVSGSLLCREGFKLVFESNKLVVMKHGLFVGKGYESGGMFRLSLADFCSKVVNHIHSNVNESEVWHSRLVTLVLVL